MAETVGSIIDKLCINKLKIYHVKERLAEEKDFDARGLYEGKLDVLQIQGKDLSEELQELLVDLASGRRQMKVYRQYKM